MHEHERISKFLPLMQSLYKASRENLGFKPHVKIVILKSDSNMTNPLGKTAHYSPIEKKIGLYTQGRHIKDILRSLSHELVHHNQNCRGDFDFAGETMPGYAQEDGHLREMEREAYECGNMIFRDWEDNLKKKGARPLFTSTSPYVPAPTSDVGGGQLFEGNKMKKNLKESHLRNIIRGVIQEMFNDDLNEAEDMVEDPDASMTARAKEQAAEEEGVDEPARAFGPSGLEEVYKATDYTKGQGTGTFKSKDPNEVRYEKAPSKKVGLYEDSGEDEAWHDWKNEHEDDDHIQEMEHHLHALKDDRDYERKESEYDHDKYEDKGYDDRDDDDDDDDDDDEAEEVRETFMPQGRSIREKARLELNEALTKRWTKIIK